MKIYEVLPKKDVKRLNLLTAALIIGSLIMLLASTALGLKPAWPFQLIGLGMLALGIFFMTRYVTKKYVYAIIDTDNGPDLTVTEINGRHTITVCRISLSGISEVYTACPADSLQMKEAIAKAKQDKRKQFNYTVDMFGEKCIFVLANECGEPLAIRLSYDEELCRLITPEQTNTKENTEQ